MKSKLVDGEIPESTRGGRKPAGLLGVFVPAIITKLPLSACMRDGGLLDPNPNIVSLLDEREGEASLFIRDANPDLAIHEQAMVKIDHRSP